MTYPPQSLSPPLTTLPPRTLLLQNLTTQTQTLSQLFNNLSFPTPNPQTISSLHTSLSHSSTELERLVKNVWDHQVAWNEFERKRKEVVGLEERVRGLIRGLEGGRRELEGLVQEGREVVRSIEKSEREPIQVGPLLSHAQSLSKTSSAPISFLIAPIDQSRYQPFPTETMMRQGILFQQEGSMSGVGDVGKLGDDPTKMHVDDRQEVIAHQEEVRRFDPNAVFELDLNSDESDED